MIERRVRERFSVDQDKFYVCANGDDKVLGTIVDISICGLSFWYPPEAMMYEENEKLTIIQKDEGVILENIPYQNCYDFEVPQSMQFSATGIRRRGVRFQGLLCEMIQFENIFGLRTIAAG